MRLNAVALHKISFFMQFLNMHGMVWHFILVVHNPLKKTNLSLFCGCRMVRVPYHPAVRLRCKMCHRQTDHALISFSNDPTSAITLLYECQECGTIKKILELNTLPEPKVLDVNESEPTPIVEHAEHQAIPIERGPQIER